MITIDKLTREAIVKCLKDALAEKNEIYDEVWLTGKQLCQQVGFFSPDWLKKYGHKLPRTTIVVRDVFDVEHRTGWRYPKKRILRMIAEGQLSKI